MSMKLKSRDTFFFKALLQIPTSVGSTTYEMHSLMEATAQCNAKARSLDLRLVYEIFSVYLFTYQASVM